MKRYYKRNRIRVAFDAQRNNAKKRSIAWCFTFEEWVKWWESELGSDWFSKRGRLRGEYVMARNGDVGPYEPKNVKCILGGDNLSQRKQLVGAEHPMVKLTTQQVREIYFACDVPIRALASAYGISPGQASKIRFGLSWSKLTRGWGPPHRKLSGRGARTDLM